MPPLTVASLATIATSRPPTTPMPVTIPADGASPSYMSQAASGDSSRNGEPGSTRRSMRSRASSLPRAGVAGHRLVAAAALDAGQPLAQLGHEREVRLAIGVERGGPRGFGEDGHRRPLASGIRAVSSAAGREESEMGDEGFYGPEQAGIHHEAFGRLAGRAADLLTTELEAAGLRPGRSSTSGAARGSSPGG